MQNIWMSGNLYLNAVYLHQAMCVLNVLLIDEMIGITRIHNDNYPILYSLLTDGEHDFIKLFLAGPLLGLITDKGCNTLNGFQLGCLVSGRSLNTSKHDSTAGHTVHNIRLGSIEIFCSSVQFNLFHHFRNNRHSSRNHRVTGIKDLVDNLLHRLLKGQSFDEGGSVETLSRSTATGDENDELLPVGV